MPLKRLLPDGGVTWPNHRNTKWTELIAWPTFTCKSIGIFSSFQMSHIIQKQTINLAAGAKGVQTSRRKKRVRLLGTHEGKKCDTDGSWDYGLLMDSGRTWPRGWAEKRLSFTKPSSLSVLLAEKPRRCLGQEKDCSQRPRWAQWYLIWKVPAILKE